MRLIDADVLTQKAINASSEAFGCGTLLVKLDDVLNAHTIDPVKHGRWIGEEVDLGGYIGQECNVCHRIRVVDNYCPNCGAKMDANE